MSNETHDAAVERLVVAAREVVRRYGHTDGGWDEMKVSVAAFDPPAPTIAEAWSLVKGAARVAGGVPLSIEVVEAALVEALGADGIPARGEKWASGHLR